MKRAAHSARRWLREPVLHFVVLGVLVLGLYHWLAPHPQSRRIVLSNNVIQGLRQEYLRRNGALPAPEEERALIRQYIDTEVLYREALALGLERGDVIVRRRLVQKMEFLTEGMEPVPEPTDGELRTYLETHMSQYAGPERVALTHVFVSADQHGTDAGAIAARLHEQLVAGADPSVLGDPFLRGRDVSLRTQPEIAAIFGAPFAAQVMALPAGTWSLPLQSSYGLHVVRVTEREPARRPDLDAVRSGVRRDWQEERRASLDRAALARLRGRYDIRIEGDGIHKAEGAAEASELAATDTR